MAVAASHQEGDHLRLELDLRLEAEGGHLGVAGNNLRLGTSLVLDLKTELGGAAGGLAE